MCSTLPDDGRTAFMKRSTRALYGTSRDITQQTCFEPKLLVV
jgi:hypothetical protein